MQLYTVYLYLETVLHVSGGISTIIRSAYNCIYNIWYLSHRYCYFMRIRTKYHSYNYENNQQDALYRLIYYSKSTLHVSGDVFAHRQERLTVFTESGVSKRHQPVATWVKTTRYCKYSQALLMMGENIARNM
jgi:hypothetical protein